MFLLMAVILVFVVILLSNFFKPQGSLNSYNQLVSAVMGACTSPQSVTNLQFNSPDAVIFQMYDNSTCDLALSSNNNLFSPNSPYSSSLKNRFDLCYAQPGTLLLNPLPSTIFVANYTNEQYYLNNSISSINTYYPTPIASTYNSADVISLSQYSAQNLLGLPDIEVTAGSGDTKDTSIEYSVQTSSKPFLFLPNIYTFEFDIYSNISSNIVINFINSGNTCQEVTELANSGPNKFVVSPSCNSAFQNVSVVFNTGGKDIQYQINISATQYSGYASGSSIGALSEQCDILPSAFKSGYLVNQTLDCQPIVCGSTTFQLTNPLNKPFLGMLMGTYSYLEVQPSLSSIQIITNGNNYEFLSNKSMLSYFMQILNNILKTNNP